MKVDWSEALTGLRELAAASSHRPEVAHTFQKLLEAGLPVLVIKRDGPSAVPAGDFSFAYQLADDLLVLLSALRDAP